MAAKNKAYQMSFRCYFGGSADQSDEAPAGTATKGYPEMDRSLPIYTPDMPEHLRQSLV